MFGFLIKKTFFDMWDNLFRIILLNLGFLAILAIFFILVPTALALPALAWVTLALGIVFLAVHTGAASRVTSEIADYKQPGFAEYWQAIRETYPTSLLLALVAIAYVLIIRVAFAFYGGLASLVGPLAVSLLFWVTVILVLAAQFVFPVQARLDKKLRKIVRKSFLILLDNPGFAIGLLVCTLVISVGSLFLAMIAPGLATVLLLWNVGLKLRLYKYDYLEKNPQANRRQIPWDALLVEDRERVGKRTLRGMIFPWKE
jgi:uncharacterized membrane protein YesL